MNKKERIEKLVNAIEKNMRELVKLIKEDYISAAIVDDGFILDSKLKEDKTQTLSVYRRQVYDRT